jgi:H/ACA ribonucleoprotein complex subunit 4
VTTWYTREEAEPSEEYGEFPENRDPDQLLQKGFVIVDKPFGPTSNQVSTWVRKCLDRRKTGHFGTLDPNATGVLPVGLNKGTRVQKALSNAGKQYVFEMELEEPRNEDEVREALQEFVGENEQVPPEKSAVKRELRTRQMYSAELLEIGGSNVLACIDVESGFYVRVLVDQLAESLDTSGEMVELRRTRQGDIEEDQADTLQDIVDAYRFYKDENREEELREVLHPIEKAVTHLPKVVIKNSAVNAVANGANLLSVGISKLEDGIAEGDLVAVMTLKGELVALATAEMSSEQMFEEDGEAANLESVHMDPEKYPRRWKN